MREAPSGRAGVVLGLRHLLEPRHQQRDVIDIPFGFNRVATIYPGQSIRSAVLSGYHPSGGVALVYELATQEGDQVWGLGSSLALDCGGPWASRRAYVVPVEAPDRGWLG
jgi:hypothetical protein